MKVRAIGSVSSDKLHKADNLPLDANVAVSTVDVDVRYDIELNHEDAANMDSPSSIPTTKRDTSLSRLQRHLPSQ